LLEEAVQNVLEIKLSLGENQTPLNLFKKPKISMASNLITPKLVLNDPMKKFLFLVKHTENFGNDQTII
jgi:hypothetical protein